MPVTEAAIYVRISQDRGGEALGVQRQEVDCRKLADRLGWHVAEVYCDNDVSAYTGKRRPAWDRLLADIQARRVTALLAWHPDRLTRRPIELEALIEIVERHRLKVATVTAGEYDLGTPTGRAVARTVGAWARQESEHKAERIARKERELAEHGRPRGGGRAFGYEADGVTVRQDEAREVAQLTRAILSGVSLGELVRDLNARGVPTATGKEWSYTSLRQVLRRARNAGLRVYKDEVVGPADWPPLVTEDVWRALCSLLDDPQRRVSANNRRRWLLSGLAFCGVEGCGLTVRMATTSNRMRAVYRCRSGRHLARAAEWIDDYVSRVIVARLQRPDVLELLAAEENENTEAVTLDAAAVRARLDELAVLVADGAMTPAQFRLANGRARKRLAEIEAQLSASSSSRALAGLVGVEDMQATWDALGLSRKRAVVEALADVYVLPWPNRSKHFDPDSVRVDWKA